MARRLDKEIWNMVADGELEKPIRMANKAGYHVEVYDGDAETGMLSPVITHMGRKPLPEPEPMDIEDIGLHLFFSQYGQAIG